MPSLLKTLLPAMLDEGAVLLTVVKEYGVTGVPDDVWSTLPPLPNMPVVETHIVGLKLSHEFTPPIHLEFVEDGVRTNLSFAKVRHDVFIPWGAIVELHMAEPREGALHVSVMLEAGSTLKRAEGPEPAKPRHLSVVKTPDEAG